MPKNNIFPGRKSRIFYLKENVLSASIHPHINIRGFLEASNKLLYFLLFFFGAIMLLLGQVFEKYHSFLFRTPIYYCQHAWCSDLIRISSILGTSLFKILAITLLFTFIKTVFNLVKIYHLRCNLKVVACHTTKLNKVTQELGLTNKIMVVDHYNPFAFCLGFFRSKIIISTTLIKILTAKELKSVLVHEKYHLENSDALTMYFAQFIRSIFPFFPIIRDQIKRFSLDREIKADRKASLILGGSSSLISTFRKLILYETLPAYSTFPSFLDTENSLEMRIRAINGKEVGHPNYSLKNIMISLVSIALMLSLRYMPIKTVNVNAVGTEEVIACLNDKSCIEACKNEKKTDDKLFNQLHPQITPQISY